MESVKIKMWLSGSSDGCDNEHGSSFGDVCDDEYRSGFGSGYGYRDGSGFGSGYHDGSGFGSGYGYRDGCGFGSGYGYSDGDGDGSGNGCGSGYGYDTGDGNGNGYSDGSGSREGFGSGHGYGDGDGDKFGHGYGHGYGCGYGCGDGYGYGDGDGDGSGYKLRAVDGERVYYVDDIPTIIKRIAGNLAKGFIISEKDFSLAPCYIARSDGYFAHGNTAAEAAQALANKILEGKSVEERIDEFVEKFPAGVKASGRDYFDWHHILTGSCLMGREQFIRDNGLDLDAEYTPEEFIALTEHAYGREVIAQLKERYMSITNDRV